MALPIVKESDVIVFNDAEVTTNIPHGLTVGSYVMLLNTTTTPNIDGIHKITKLGEKSNVFYIDEYIESCGNAVSVLPLVTTRFASKDQRETALLSNSWNLPVNKIVFANTNPTGTENLRGTYVRIIQSYDIHSAGTTIQAGNYYRIQSVGTTDFTTIGASANTVGTIQFNMNGQSYRQGSISELRFNHQEGKASIKLISKNNGN